MSPTNNFSLIVLLLLVLHTNTQQCALPNSNIDLLQSDQIVVTNTLINTAAKRQHQFTILLNFNAPSGVKIAASASSFQVTAANGIDFSIGGGAGKTAGTGLIILLINQDNTWSSIKMSYFASGRSDFFLGSFAAALYLSQRQSQSSLVSVSEDIIGWTASTKSFHVIIYISGVRTSAINPVIALTAVSFNETTGTIVTTMTLNTTFIVQSVVISYVIADKSSPISYVNVSVLTATYQFFGIDQLQNGNSTIGVAGFNSNVSNGLICVGAGCPSTCVSSQTCISYSGVLTTTNCFICAPGQIVSNGKCVTSSNNCSANQNFNGTSCVCNVGYILVNNICYVSCGINAYVLNSQCQCIPNYFYSAVANQCIPQSSACGTNFVLINNQCVCPSGFGILNTQCVVCPTNSFVDASGNCTCSTSGMVFDNFTNICIFCNGIGRAIVNGRCGCSPNFYPTDTACLSCIANSTYNLTNKTCVCNQNYSLVNGNCILSNTTCPPNSTLNTTTQQCVCNTQGQYIINGVCQACPQFSAWNGSSCICNATYFNINGTCLQCDANSFYSSTLSTCICNNGFFGTFNSCTRCHPSCFTCSGASSSQCLTCPINTNLISGTCLFACAAGTYQTNTNQCLPCDLSCATCNGPANTQCLTCRSNGILVNGTCRVSCAAGTYLSSNNQCLPCDSSCAACSGPGNAVCTSCFGGFTLINGVCRANTPNNSSRLSLKGFVLGNQVIYQGVALSLLPTPILSNGCTICNNLFLITVNSKFSTITTTQQFLNTTQYWWMITFNFTDASSIPTFEFTIKINPIHSNFFTSADMAQLLTGSFSQSMFNQAALVNTVPMIGTLTNPLSPKINGFSAKTIQQVFGSLGN